MTRDVIVVIDGGWGLLMFFEPFSKSSGGLSYILFITVHSITFTSIDDPTLFHHWILVLGAIRRFLMVTPPLKYTCTSYVASSFNTFTESLVVGYNHIGLLVTCLVVDVDSVFLLLGRFLHLHFTLLIAHVGYLHLVRTLERCSSSLFNLSGVEQTVFALWCSVPTTLYFEEMGWWLSHFRYMSVWVGFL